MPFTKPSHTPGVFVFEGPAKSRPIAGVATSVAAFIGLAPAGPVNTPTQVTSWMDFERKFGAGKHGAFMPGAFLAHSVFGFFQNGGSLAWIVRIGTPTFGGRPAVEVSSSIDGAPAPFELVVRDDTALAKPVLDKDGHPVKGDDGNPVPATPVEFAAELAADGGSEHDPTFKLTVTATAGKDVTTESWQGLTLTPGPTYLVTQVNAAKGGSAFVTVVPTGEALTSKEIVPKAGSYALAPVDVKAVTAPDSDDIKGDEGRMTGLSGLALADEVTTVCVPDLMSIGADETAIADVQDFVTTFCAKGRRMAILDPPKSFDDSQILEWREQHVKPNAFATLYWPWIEVMDPITNAPIQIPPCGHVAGAWAGTDALRGVHKAPANVPLAGVLGLAFNVNDAGQGGLNDLGVNCIRTFPGRGTLIWGARTLEPDSEWTYINVRRLFNYLMASILQSTQWAVFEPNDEVLWGQLNVSVSNFLTRTWRSGALFGASPDEAFFVKCDHDTNPPELIEVGQVNIQIGVAPVKPAEFVVFEISQFQPGT
ncbi:MAG: phage tail sheath family protein [Conexibacter sp.]|nr:phage tail sheath family protein [Solirubrobacterales bacterium]MCW3004784.1 phage tail sheath family protein [Conexibacter sp.]